MLPSRLDVSSLERGRGRGQAGAVAAAADTQVAQWKPGRDTAQNKRAGDEHKHANNRATVASDGTPTQRPHRAAHREAH